MEDNKISPGDAKSPIPGDSLNLPLPSIEIHPPSDSEDAAVEPNSDGTFSHPNPNPYPVVVGNLWEVDFDFSQRKKPVSRAKKLVNSFNRISQLRSPSKMASEAGQKDDNTNATAAPGSLADHSADLLSPGQIERTNSPTTVRNPKPSDFIFHGTPMSIDEAAMLAVSPEPFALEPDRLPTNDKRALEARLNYHLSELDHLKKYINHHNDNIFQTAHRADMIEDRATPDEVKSIRIMRELSNAQRVLRNVAKPFVEFHRNEIDRIAEIRVQMNAADGLGRKVPQIFKNLPNDYEWAEMFMA